MQNLKINLSLEGKRKTESDLCRTSRASSRGNKRGISSNTRLAPPSAHTRTCAVTHRQKPKAKNFVTLTHARRQAIGKERESHEGY